MPQQLVRQFEVLIRRDPARRGLIGTEAEHGELCPGHLLAAAEHLAEHAVSVAIVTGFFVPHGAPPSAETDGPPGAVLLAAAFSAVGIETVVLTDEHCQGAVQAAASATGLPDESVLIAPSGSADWVRWFFVNGPGRRLTHLIAIERAGPSHTPESFRAQHRDRPPPTETFESHSPAETHNRCHNMRGRIIDDHTADLHRLFEMLGTHRPDAVTIGIGDGANEIGMGAIPWEELHRRLNGGRAGRIPCRIATDWNIVAGTSNWGGYALAAATVLLRDRIDVMRPWGDERQQQVLEQMVRNGPAVDGITARQEPTVDGLPFLTYIQPCTAIRRLLGWED